METFPDVRQFPLPQLFVLQFPPAQKFVPQFVPKEQLLPLDSAVQPNPREAAALSEQTAVQISALAGTAVQITVAAETA